MSTLPDMAGMADLTLEEEEKLLEERGDALLRGDYDLALSIYLSVPAEDSQNYPDAQQMIKAIYLAQAERITAKKVE